MSLSTEDMLVGASLLSLIDSLDELNENISYRFSRGEKRSCYLLSIQDRVNNNNLQTSLQLTGKISGAQRLKAKNLANWHKRMRATTSKDKNYKNPSYHPHQSHIEILSELGLVGYLAFLFFFTTVSSLRHRPQPSSPFGGSPTRLRSSTGRIRGRR